MGAVILIGVSWVAHNFIITLNQSQAETYFIRGEESFKQQNYTDALKNFRRAIKYDPTLVQAYLNQAEIYLLIRQLNECQEALVEAEKYSPQNYQIFLLRAKMHLINAEVEKAENSLRKALELKQDLTEAQFLLGLILTVSKPEEAEHYLTQASRELEKASAFRTTFKETLSEENEAYRKSLLAYALLKEEQPAIALLVLIPLTQDLPYYRDGHLLAGAAYLQLRNYEKAEQLLLKAKELDPNYPNTYQLLGQLYLELEEDQKAQENFQRAKELGG